MDRIVVRRGGVGEIAREVGASRATVGIALAGGSYSQKAEEIRRLAIDKYGGKVMVLKDAASD